MDLGWGGTVVHFDLMTVQNCIVLSGAAIVFGWMCYACVINRTRQSRFSPKYKQRLKNSRN